MNFSSLIFIFFFLPIFIFIYKIIPKKYRYIILLLFSIIFYLYSGIYNFIIILTVSLINFLTTLLISKYKKLTFLYYLLIILNIITLFIFKYNTSLIFPLGISFYIFNSLSYIIDLKREKIKIEKNIFRYLTYIMLFTHVTMGPLTRYNSFNSDLLNLSSTTNDLYEGFKRFLNGLIKKVLIADNLGLLFNNLLEINNPTSFLNIFILIVFALELYIDFYSYCDMAIGLGKIIGINYKENFDYPYLSTTISEFWRRWHITLGEFFKEYVYIPLGGNRVSIPRCIINLLIVWLLTGMWHGNTLNFIIWGLYYGIIIILEKYLFKNVLIKIPNIIKHIYVIICLLFGYIFFIGVDIIPFIKTLFSTNLINHTTIFYIKENVLLVLIGIILCFKFPNKLKEKIDKSRVATIIVPVIYIILFVITISYIVSGSYHPFLYNKF